MPYKNAENILHCNYLLCNFGLHLEQYFQDFPNEHSKKKNTKNYVKKKERENFKDAYKETFKNV